MLVNRVDAVEFVPPLPNLILQFLPDIRSGIGGEQRELGRVCVELAGETDCGPDIFPSFLGGTQNVTGPYLEPVSFQNIHGLLGLIRTDSFMETIQKSKTRRFYAHENRVGPGFGHVFQHVGISHNGIRPAETPPMDIPSFFENPVAYVVHPFRRTGKVVVCESHGPVPQMSNQILQFSQDVFSASGTPFGPVKTGGRAKPACMGATATRVHRGDGPMSQPGQTVF